MRAKYLLIVVITLILTLIIIPHIVNKPGLKTINKASLITTNESMPINIDMPIYVVGPSTLVQELIGVGINQSLIKPITINELPNLPNNSIIIIDWSVIRSLLYLINETGINAASPVINTLMNLLKRGDLVLVSINRSSLPIGELVLAYSLARLAVLRLVVSRALIRFYTQLIST